MFGGKEKGVRAEINAVAMLHMPENWILLYVQINIDQYYTIKTINESYVSLKLLVYSDSCIVMYCKKCI